MAKRAKGKRRGIDMNEVITREEHNRDIDRVHGRLDKQDDSILRVELAVQKIEGVGNSQYKIWQRIYEELYGKDGLKERVIKNSVHKNIHWALISAVIIGIVGRALWVIVSK